MQRKTKRLLSVALTTVAAGVFPGMIMLAASRIYFAANAVPIEPGSLGMTYAVACGVASFIAGGLWRSRDRSRCTPDFRLSPPSGAVIGKARDAGIPVGAMVIRESITVNLPSCGKPDGGGWVYVNGLDYDSNGDRGSRSWLVTYCLTGRPNGPDPLVFMEQLDDDESVIAQITAAYRGGEMSVQHRTT